MAESLRDQPGCRRYGIPQRSRAVPADAVLGAGGEQLFDPNHNTEKARKIGWMMQCISER